LLKSPFVGLGTVTVPWVYSLPVKAFANIVFKINHLARLFEGESSIVLYYNTKVTDNQAKTIILNTIEKKSGTVNDSNKCGF
jgi:hypothetical protein